MTVLQPFEVNRAFGERLRQAREAAGLSQSELANRSQLGRTTIANIEIGGQAATMFQMITLASALGVEPSKLLPDMTERHSSDDMLASIVRQRQAILSR